MLTFFLSLQRDEATRQCRDLSQELVNPRGELGKLDYLGHTVELKVIIHSTHSSPRICFSSPFWCVFGLLNIRFIWQVRKPGWCWYINNDNSTVCLCWILGLFCFVFLIYLFVHLIQLFCCCDLIQLLIWVSGAFIFMFIAYARLCYALVNWVTHYIT